MTLHEMLRTGLLRALVLGVVLHFAAGSAVPGASAAQAQDESRVKAAFLMRFGQFIEWPQDAFQQSGGALVISVAGSDTVLAGIIELTAERTTQGRRIIARPLKSADELAQTHILFVGSDERGRLEQHIANAANRPILIITDTPKALERGAMINFLTVDNRVRFEIGLDSAEKAGLTVSSRLLSIATRVYRGGLSYPTLMARLAGFAQSVSAR